MIAFRDILIFAGLVALAAAVIASLFPMREGVSPVPACSDCAFKLTGGYWIRQYGNYAALYLGTREAARYGWAYVDGRPLGVGEAVGCDPMYVHVLNGLAYVSCNSNNSTLGRVLPTAAEGVDISAHPSRPGCTFTVDVMYNTSTTVRLEVYDENGRLIYSASGTPPVSFNFNASVAGTYRMHVYAPPLLDDWYTLYAKINIKASRNVAVYTSNSTEDLRPDIALKIIDITDYWKKGYDLVWVAPGPTYYRYGPPRSDAFADFILGWHCCYPCDRFFFVPHHVYLDEVWRLTFTPSGPVFTHIDDQIERESKYVYVDGKYVNARNGTYTGSDPTITVKFVSSDSKMNAEAVFTKVCSWS